MTRSLLALAAVLAAGFAAAKPDPVNPDFESKRPIEARDTVFMEEMTWMEIRDAMRSGKTTAIVATGGLEQNGPYVAAGKHNYVLRATTEAIARKLGDALVSTIVPYVPEGQFDPPTEHMRYPGTISVTEETYEGLVTDICRSLRAHGFEHLVLLGDSGGNQEGLKAVAGRLNQEWKGSKTRVHHIAEYYDYPDVAAFVEKNGIQQEPEGYHDDFAMEAMIMTVDPNAVRTNERMAAGLFRINGVELAPAEKTIEWGRKIVEFRANKTVTLIEAARSGR